MKMMPQLNSVINGDCMEVMRSWPDNCVDAVVTDPPYGIRFMGKAWDGADIDATAKRKNRKGTERPDGYKRNDGVAFAAGTYDLAPEAMRNFQAWTTAWSAEALRVLKPGGHLLAFASTRTYHRMASGVEDAGFEIRDQLQWIYGSGFPKSLNISKAIDKAAGAERIKVMVPTNPGNHPEHAGPIALGASGMRNVAAPATDAAKAWEGWGTALKPANEPIVLARKPIAENTIAANVIKWGVGALNIDAARIASAEGDESLRWEKPRGMGFSGGHDYGPCVSVPNQSGRWPANVIFDQYAAGMLDAQMSDASRFFYMAKPDGGERDHGIEGETVISAAEITGRKEGSAGLNSPRAGKMGASANFHPTVKPVDLMAYLIKLVTPRGGVVLDPFLGSGTTAIAAEKLMTKWVGCEMSAEYVELAKKRIAAETSQGKLL